MLASEKNMNDNANGFSTLGTRSSHELAFTDPSTKDKKLTILRIIVWLVMAFLALPVAGYAGALAIGFRPDFAQAIFAALPIIAVMHFGGGAVALAAGALQVNSTIRTRVPRFHRWLGLAYVLGVSLGGIAALRLSVRSSGGMVAHFGFGALAVLWVSSTLNAYRHVRAKRYRQHRNWMLRSYALTYGAVTLRLYLPASLLVGIPFSSAYPVIAWIAWVPNLAIVEWFIFSRGYNTPVTLS